MAGFKLSSGGLGPSWMMAAMQPLPRMRLLRRRLGHLRLLDLQLRAAPALRPSLRRSGVFSGGARGRAFGGPAHFKGIKDPGRHTMASLFRFLTSEVNLLATVVDDDFLDVHNWLVAAHTAHGIGL